MQISAPSSQLHSSLQGSSGPSSVMLSVFQSLMKDTDTVTLLLALVPVEPETLY